MDTNAERIARRAGLSPEKRALLEKRLRGETIETPVQQTIPKRTGSGPFPMSYAQQRLWLLYQLDPHSTAYKTPSFMRLTGKLHVDVLTRAFQEIVNRHEDLRTTFTVEQEQPVQIIHANLSIQIPVHDLRGCEQAEREALIKRLAQAEAEQTFNLETGPLLQMCLVRTEEQEHLLIFTLHHIISDGWSSGVLIRELMTLYEAFSEGQPSPLPELSIQYADYALWQRESLQGELLEKQLGYWKNQLANAPTVLQLPVDHKRPLVQTTRGASLSFALSPAQSVAVHQFSQAQGVTPYMFLLSVFKILLYRWSGQQDLLVGSPIAGRSRQEIEGLIGFFVNTLVLRTQLQDDANFLEILTKVKRVTIEAYAHQDLPFEKIVEELHPERNLSHTPLFQVIFVLQNAPRTTQQIPSVQWELLESELMSSKFDLVFNMAQDGEQLDGRIEYNRDLFEESTIARMSGHFQQLVDAVVANPKQPISRLTMLTKEERDELLLHRNQTLAPYPEHDTAHGLFEQHAMLAPDAVAIVDREETLTYGELNRRANQLAHFLQKQGVRRGQRVGLLMERSTSLLVSILGILKAGGAYLPLDPTYPEARLTYMLEDSNASLLLTQTSLAEHVQGCTQPVFCFDTLWHLLDVEGAMNLPHVSQPDDLFYLIYTSGTTGQPKGVCCAHRGVLNLFADVEARSKLTHDARCSVWTSFGFDVSVYELFSALCFGRSLYIVPEDIRGDSVAYFRWLMQQEVQSAYIPPFMIKELANWLEQGAGILHLQRLLVGVESIYEPLLGTIALHVPNVTIINGYGPTETSICATLYTFDPKRTANRQTPIGQPVRNMQIYLLDAYLQPVPLGITGELYIGGVGLAHGYHNQLDLTAEKFIPHPFVPGERLYRTGDLARYLPDGTLEYCTRIDGQVKLRGFRVELSEIEAQLLTHPAVREAAVIIWQDEEQEPRIVAYVSTTEQEVETATLRQHMQTTLPTYMIPSAIVQMEKIPVTPNGKVNRAELPCPTFKREASGTDYVAPRSLLEWQLVEQFADILQMDRVGVHDNFFELGGHSLMATRLVSRIRTNRQVELPLRSLFEYPTVALLAAQISLQPVETQASERTPIHAQARDGVLPLSFAQERLWFFEQFESGTATYNLPCAVRLRGELHTEALQLSLNEIVRRHESLRTRFTSIAAQPVQVIEEQVELPFRCIDLLQTPREQCEELLIQIATEEAQLPFDFERDLLIRSTLVSVDDREHVLLLTMHHIVSDGWSMGVLLQELTTLYESFVQNCPVTLPELDIQYADYALHQREWLSGDILDAQCLYWKNQLAGELPILQLPTDHPRPAIQTHRGETHHVQVPLDLTEKLKSLSQEMNVTLFMTMLAAFNTLLYRFTGQDDLLVGSPIAGRTHAEVEQLIGFFVNTLVLRTDLSGDPSFTELLNRQREVALSAFAHQDLPFERLLEEVKPERTMSYSPLFQVLFVLQNAPVHHRQMDGLTLELLEIDRKSAKYDLSLYLTETSEGLSAAFEYNSDLFEAETMIRWGEHFLTLLGGIVERPNAKLRELPLLSETEQHNLLENFGHAPFDMPEGLLLHQLFEIQVAKSPDRIALYHAQETISYREVNERANRLAWSLRKRGIGADQVIGIMLPPSTNQIVALLAVLKAGGAYVPIDTSYPLDRIAYLLEDSQAHLLITADGIAESLPFAGEVIALNTESLEEESTRNLPVQTKAQHLAYLMYTSGSTGRPKGVMIEHQNLVSHTLSAVATFGMTDRDIVLQQTSISFDVSATEIYPTLTVGGQLVIVDRDDVHDIERLCEIIQQQRVTVVCCAPLLLNELNKRLVDHQIRLVLSAGDILKKEYFSVLRSTTTKIWNAYGPTETTVYATYYPCTDQTGAQVPIGKTLPSNRVLVLDAHLNLQPIRIYGELCIGGLGVARGYHNRPALTSEKFVNNPYQNEERIYRTGDLVRWLPDGNIEFMGRLDNQVKIRGYRIELGEIENALAAHPALREVAVVLHRQEESEKELCAYLVTDVELTVSELRSFLSQTLPPYMIPATYVRLEELPVTANGKLNRKALPAPDDTLHTGTVYVAPQSATEEKLVQIWQELLDIETIGVHDHFFDLGGSSIKLIALSKRIQEAFATECRVVDLFRLTTIAELAEHLDGQTPVEMCMQEYSL